MALVLCSHERSQTWGPVVWSEPASPWVQSGWARSWSDRGHADAHPHSGEPKTTGRADGWVGKVRVWSYRDSSGSWVLHHLQSGQRPRRQKRLRDRSQLAYCTWQINSYNGSWVQFPLSQSRFTPFLIHLIPTSFFLTLLPFFPLLHTGIYFT